MRSFRQDKLVLQSSPLKFVPSQISQTFVFGLFNAPCTRSVSVCPDVTVLPKHKALLCISHASFIPSYCICGFKPPADPPPASGPKNRKRKQTGIGRRKPHASVFRRLSGSRFHGRFSVHSAENVTELQEGSSSLISFFTPSSFPSPASSFAPSASVFMYSVTPRLPPGETTTTGHRERVNS